MTTTRPAMHFDRRYSSENAEAASWQDAIGVLETAELFWLATVRSDGRPHVVPLNAVWHDGAMHFCTGADEQKVRNLATNPHCSITTGHNVSDGGLDVIVEGVPRRITDQQSLQDLASAWESKYGAAWHFDVGDGVFRSGDHEAFVFRIAPITAYGFGKGEVSSQTRWTF